MDCYFTSHFAPCFNPGVLIFFDNEVDLMAYISCRDQRKEEML